MAKLHEAVEDTESSVEFELEPLEANGELYNLKYSLIAIESIENATDKTMMELFSSIAQGDVQLRTLKTVFCRGLVDADGVKIPSSAAGSIFDTLIQSIGMAMICAHILIAVQRDCGFFFKGI